MADTDNSTIRKITPAGDVTTIAGLALAPGSSDGLGSAARFAYPVGIAADPSGNLFVSDFGNSTIRKMAPDGTVSTLAGLAGVTGSADGLGNAARFNDPWGIAVSGANIFVADYLNSTIRRITSTGLVTTVAGAPGQVGTSDGAGPSARFAFPTGIAVDGAGNVFVSDSSNELIRKVSPAFAVVTLAGSAGQFGNVQGVGSQVRFQSPQGLAVDPNGQVYIADYGNNVIRRGAIPDFSLRITSIVQVPGGGTRITGVARPQQSVAIEATPTFVQPYAAIATVLADGNGIFEYVDSAAAGAARRFYRAVE